MDREIDELKRQLRGKRFAIDDIVPLAEKAARTIERLQAENAVLKRELLSYLDSEKASSNSTEICVSAAELQAEIKDEH